MPAAPPASSLPPHLLAKLTGKAPAAPAQPAVAAAAKTEPVVAPPAVAAKLGVQTPAAASRGFQGMNPTAPARSPLLPPEAPVDPRARKAEAEAMAAHAQQVAARPSISSKDTILADIGGQQPVVEAQVEGGDLLISLGWSVDEVNAMTDEVFAATVGGKWKREDCEIGFGDPEPDGFQMIVRVSPTATKIHQVARPQRVARVAAAPAPTQPVVVVAVTETMTQTTFDGKGPEKQVEITTLVMEPAAEQPAAEAPRRRGRPPGSKNKATLAAEQAQAAPTPAADPVVESIQAALDEAHADGEVVDGTPEGTTAEEAAEAVRTVDFSKETGVAELQARIAELEAKLSEADQGLQEYGDVFRANEDLRAEVARLKQGAPAGQFVLYVDCLPETITPDLRVLDTVLAPLMAKVVAEYVDEKTGRNTPLSHYSLVPFGKGPGLVAAHVLTNLGHFVQPGALYVDTRSPCAAAVLEVLRPKADLVVSARGR